MFEVLCELREAKFGGRTSVGVTLALDSALCVDDIRVLLREREFALCWRPGEVTLMLELALILPPPPPAVFELGPETDGLRLLRPPDGPAMPIELPIAFAIAVPIVCLAEALSFIVLRGELPAAAGGLRSELAV